MRYLRGLFVGTNRSQMDLSVKKSFRRSVKCELTTITIRKPNETELMLKFDFADEKRIIAMFPLRHENGAEGKDNSNIKYTLITHASHIILTRNPNS